MSLIWLLARQGLLVLSATVLNVDGHELDSPTPVARQPVVFARVCCQSACWFVERYHCRVLPHAAHGGAEHRRSLPVCAALFCLMDVAAHPDLQTAHRYRHREQLFFILLAVAVKIRIDPADL